MSEKENSKNADGFQDWKYCPNCGAKIPETEKAIRYCVSCGVQFDNISFVIEKPIQMPKSTKLTEEELDKNREAALWSANASIGWPILSIFIMNAVSIVPFIFLVIFIPDLSRLMDFIESPLFLIIFSASEFVFLIVPLIYVGQYLEKPTVKNRFKSLGLYVEPPTLVYVIKELLLGIGFAILGFFLVNLISLFLELFFSSLFIFPNIFTAQAPSVDLESIISSANIIEIILLVVIMIVIIGLSEEVAFRGFMQKGLVKNFGKKLGIWLTAIIFALIHVVTIFLTLSPLSILISFLTLFPPYLFLSLFLGYLFYWRNSNLIAPIVAHGVYDAITVLLVFFFYQNFAFLLPFALILIGLTILTFSSYYILEHFHLSNKSFNR
jgi:membrane protease YdiL (CAAX protease family)